MMDIEKLLPNSINWESFVENLNVRIKIAIALSDENFDIIIEPSTNTLYKYKYPKDVLDYILNQVRIKQLVDVSKIRQSLNAWRESLKESNLYLFKLVYISSMLIGHKNYSYISNATNISEKSISEIHKYMMMYEEGEQQEIIKKYKQPLILLNGNILNVDSMIDDEYINLFVEKLDELI